MFRVAQSRPRRKPGRSNPRETVQINLPPNPQPPRPSSCRHCLPGAPPADPLRLGGSGPAAPAQPPRASGHGGRTDCVPLRCGGPPPGARPDAGSACRRHAGHDPCDSAAVIRLAAIGSTLYLSLSSCRTLTNADPISGQHGSNGSGFSSVTDLSLLPS